jgi:hypothetical protein
MFTLDNPELSVGKHEYYVYDIAPSKISAIGTVESVHKSIFVKYREPCEAVEMRRDHSLGSSSKSEISADILERSEGPTI